MLPTNMNKTPTRLWFSERGTAHCDQSSPWTSSYRKSNGNFSGRGRKFKRSDYRSFKEKYCKSCEIQFETTDLHAHHLQTHVKCHDSSCNFEAQKEIVDLHYRINHLSNFGDQTQRLDTPEEIEKWRADRRSNFPTAKKIAQKIALTKDRTKRGELLETEQFGKFKKRRRELQNGIRTNCKEGALNDRKQLKRPFPKRRRKRQSYTHEYSNQQPDDVESEIIHPIWGLKKFDGISCKADSDKDEGEITDSDSDINFPSPQKEDSSVPTICNSLKLLSQNYKSSSEDDVDEAAKDVTLLNQVETTRSEPIKQTKIDFCKENKSVELKRRFTLLQMLLAPDVRHERNVILQCVRYVVNHNYFD